MKRSTRSKPEKVIVGNVTVRIYKRRRATARGEFRTIYEVSDYADGARRPRSFTEHETSRAEALKIARQIASGDTTAASMVSSAGNNRDAHNMPSTRAVGQICEDLLQLLFPGFHDDDAVHHGSLAELTGERMR